MTHNRQHSPVLVLGESTRSTLAVVRSLGRQGLVVHLGTSDSATAVARSRYVCKTIVLPSERVHRTAWVDAIRQAHAEHHYALIVPTTESTAIPLVDEQEKGSDVRYAVPDKEAFYTTYDKVKTLELARTCKVPVPHTVVVHTADELDSCVDEVSLPVIVKPAFSKLWDGDTGRGFSVATAHTRERVRLEALARLEHAPVLLQNYVSGVGVGQEFLCNKGEIVLAFQHNRVREHAGSGGSTYRVSAPLHQAMLDASRTMIRKLGWTGVLMVEYRWDEYTDSFALIEINGRFWGSLALPVALGVDFPYALYELLVHNTLAHQPAYKTGVFARDVFPDMRRVFAGPGWARVLRGGAALGQGVLRVLMGRERWDFFAWDDPRPALSETARVLYRECSKFFNAARAIVVRVVGKRDSNTHADLVAALEHADHVLFVCYGGINRSAFAAAYLQQRVLHEGETHTVHAQAACTYEHEGRPASPEAIVTARSYDTSLAEHRSQRLSHKLVEWADVILYFDQKNRRDIATMYPSAQSKMYPLALVKAESRALDIADPYGHDTAYFARTFAHIQEYVDDVYKLMNGKSALK